MIPPPLSAAQAILNQYHAVLYGIIDDAYKLVQANPDCPVSTSRTRAGLARDHMVSLARQRLVPLGATLITTTNGLFLFRIGHFLILRFKKLKQNGHSSNYPTQQAERYNQQQPLMNVPNLPRLDVGYTLDKLGNIDRILVSCPYGRQVAWTYDIPGPAIAAVVPLPLVPTAPPVSAPAVLPAPAPTTPSAPAPRRTLTPKAKTKPKTGPTNANDQ